MPARFVTTSLVTKRAGIAARFVTLVTKRAVVTKRSATGALDLYLHAAVHRRGQRPPKGSGTNMTVEAI